MIAAASGFVIRLTVGSLLVKSRTEGDDRLRRSVRSGSARLGRDQEGTGGLGLEGPRAGRCPGPKAVQRKEAQQSVKEKLPARCQNQGKFHKTVWVQVSGSQVLRLPPGLRPS